MTNTKQRVEAFGRIVENELRRNELSNEGDLYTADEASILRIADTFAYGYLTLKSKGERENCLTGLLDTIARKDADHVRLLWRDVRRVG